MTQEKQPSGDGLSTAMKLSDEDPKALHASWESALDAEMRLGRVRAQLKIEEGSL
jgi:hypothetical protein